MHIESIREPELEPSLELSDEAVHQRFLELAAHLAEDITPAVECQLDTMPFGKILAPSDDRNRVEPTPPSLS
jgi:hypothetical protein